MKRLIAQIFVLICFLAGGASAETRQIGPDAAWNPGSSFRQRVLERCSVEKATDFGACFVAYRLQDGCHACELLGTVLIAFDFESSGTFVGAKLLDVTSNLREFSDPSLEIEVAPGQHFTLVLDSNATTGYLWEIISPKESTIIRLVGSEYRKLQTGLIGAGGKEVWIFEATGKGKTEIIFKYIRPWEKDVPPAKTVTFKVNIKG